MQKNGRFSFVIQDVDEQRVAVQMRIGAADEAKVVLSLVQMAMGAGNFERAFSDRIRSS